MSIRDRLGTELFRKVAGPQGERQRERVHGTPGPRWFEPRSPITVSRPWERWETNSQAPAARSASSTASRGMSGSPSVRLR